jgi:D-alanyl-D-alanine carboxypeptidase
MRSVIVALDKRIRSVLAAARVPGCSLAVVDANRILWSSGFGFADLRREIHAEPATIYHLFSATKLFTATAVMRLAEQGSLQLEDPVTAYLPEAATAEGVTLLHLLSHQSGLKDTLRAFLAVSFAGEPHVSTAEALARYRLRSAQPPGKVVKYRNVNYALLGEVVSRVSGLGYEDYVRREVLEPLAMQADFAYSDAARRNAATGYVDRWDPMRLLLAVLSPDTARRLYRERVNGLVELNDYRLDSAAIGGLVGSTVEFSRFLRAQLSGGGGVLTPESTHLMQQRVAWGVAGIASRAGVGLGWKLGEVDGRRFLNHEGIGAGFTAELRIYPEAGIGISLAMNGMRLPRTVRAAHEICEAVHDTRHSLDG